MQADPTQSLVAKLQELPPERVAEVEDFIDFLRQRCRAGNLAAPEPKLLGFPVDHISRWPDGLSLRREDMYGEDGR